MLDGPHGIWRSERHHLEQREAETRVGSGGVNGRARAAELAEFERASHSGALRASRKA
jgi:hypothetical protein